PGTVALLAHDLLGEQHAAREDVALDEVHAVAIAVPVALDDGDALDRRRTAGLEPVIERAEIDRPMGFAHGLDHFHRSNPVELAPGVAIIFEDEIDLAVEAMGLHPVLGEFKLLARERDAAEFRPRLAHLFGDTAPAAADLEDLLAGGN